MTGNVSIDLSLENIWRSYYRFKAGKQLSAEIIGFNYYLEKNLHSLFTDLNNGTYRHGGYRYFMVNENKQRRIAVASIRDRVAHRLLYDYLVAIYDKSFIYDVWSNRSGKGLLTCLGRTQALLKKNRHSFVWRSDIKKCFDSISQENLLVISQRKIKDQNAFAIIREVIKSFGLTGYGLPIGNLTSQILSNIYLNEFDRLVVNELRPRGYVRYGDDFIIIENEQASLLAARQVAIGFLKYALGLELNRKSDIIMKVGAGLHFLGSKLMVDRRELNKRNIARLKKRLNISNSSSYYGLVKNFQPSLAHEFYWRTINLIENDA